MRKIWDWIKNNPNRAMFIVPIILVAIVSISHVVSWYDIMNPYNWAIYLSIAIEIGAMTALVAATNKIKGGVWVMFGLVTFIQMLGNIFFSYKEIDATGDLFKSWMELTAPVWEMLGSDVNDVIVHKRWLAFLGGGLLPIISLTSLHFFIKYEDPSKNEPLNPKFLDKTNQDAIKKEIVVNEKEQILNDNLVSRKYEIFETTTTTQKNDTSSELKEIINYETTSTTFNSELVNEIFSTTTTQKSEIIVEVEEVINNETTTTTTTEGKRILSYTKEQ
jgi:hypothetical protein